MTVFIAPDPTRSFFERVVKSVSGTFSMSEEEVRNNFILSPETVLIANKLQPNKSAYQFSPRNNVGASFPTDNRLDQNDYFAIQSIGLKIRRRTYTSATGADSQYGNYPKFSYPEPLYFNGNPAAGLDEWECLQTIVNGQYSFNVGSQQIIAQDTCQKLFYNPNRPYTSAVLQLPEYNGLGDPASRGLYSLPMK